MKDKVVYFIDFYSCGQIIKGVVFDEGFDIPRGQKKEYVLVNVSSDNGNFIHQKVYKDELKNGDEYEKQYLKQKEINKITKKIHELQEQLEFLKKS